LGVGPDMANKILRSIGELDPDYEGERPPWRARLLDVEAYLTERQDWDTLTVVKAGPGGPAQRASESLVCIRVNELHGTRATLPLVHAVTHAMIDTWLQGKPERLGVFERFEESHQVRLREPDGSLVRVNTHQGRHFWVTTALQAGASTIDMARWQGREHLGDIAAYDQRSMADRVRMVKDAIRNGALKGPVAQVYVQLADDVRDVWLEGQIQAAHVTPLGICVHDFTASPCQYALNCVKACPDYLVDPASPEQRVQLVQLQTRSKDALARMRPRIEEGKLAPSWVKETEETLRGVERALAAIDGSTQSGFVRPNPAGPSRLVPLPEVS
jgi:hypothetical protein